MRRLIISSVLAFVTAASFGASPLFRPDSYLRHVRYLASDDLKGRGNGTPELDRAAEYIADQFKMSGLQPSGDGGTYFQKFMVSPGSRLGTQNKLRIQAGSGFLDAELHRDFVPFAVGENVRLQGEVIFAGYGITAEEYSYDDYRDLSVTDKLVLVLADEPREKEETAVFNGKEMTLYSREITKAINAKYRGARALLIVQDPLNHPDEAADLPNRRAAEEVDELGICGIRITRAVAQKLLGGQNRSLLEIQKEIDAKLAPQSFAVAGVSAQVDLDVVRVRKEVRNVVGMLPATSAAGNGEIVILGAHYDHLGLGGRSSMAPQLIGQPHNGADDNASGTAGLIELAAALGADAAPRKRAYLLIAFAGEELGLLGSAYWANNPTLPVEKAIAMINMDMIGRANRNQITVGGVGTSPDFLPILQSAASEAGLEARTTQAGHGSSDHTSFYVKNIPVLFFFSGLHADYHRPSDDWDKINAEGAAKVLDMVFRVATRLNSFESRPKFSKIDAPAPVGPARGGASGYGSYFGSIPDMAEEVKGVKFADIRPESPAAKAGLKAGDTLVRFAGKEVSNLQDFTYLLRTHKPGDVVEVTVMREGKPLTVQVKLEVRR